MQTRVTIKHSDGGAATRVKVSMKIQGILTGGWCKDAYTDSHGVAVIEHSSEGTGEIYVNGRCIGKLRVPGSDEFRC